MRKLDLPDTFDDYDAFEIEEKGYFENLPILWDGEPKILTFFDPVRLSQDIQADLDEGYTVHFSHLVVVSKLTTEQMQAALDNLPEDFFD